MSPPSAEAAISVPLKHANLFVAATMQAQAVSSLLLLSVPAFLVKCTWEYVIVVKHSS